MVESTVARVCRAIENLAPPAAAESWDNCGLQVGDLDAPATGVLVALESDLPVLQYAKENGFNFVLCHHPLLLSPLRSIERRAAPELFYAMQNGLAIYAAHTSLDAAKNGVNYLLADILELKALAPLPSPDGGESIGLRCRPLRRMTLGRLAEAVMERLDIDCLRYAGDPAAKVKHIALVGGSGGGLLDAALAADVDVFLSGDLKYHDARKALRRGLSVIDFGHYASEKAAMNLFVKKFARHLKEKGIALPVAAAPVETDPIKILTRESGGKLL